MENFRDKMREMFSTPNKTNSAKKVPFWSVLECFGVVCGVCKNLTKPDILGFGILQFVAKFATGRNRKEG